MPRKSRLSKEKITKLIEHFIAGTPARSSAILCGVSRKTATHWYHRFREIIYTHIAHHVYVFDGEIEADESYFGGRRKGKRGRGALGKTIVFGLYKRNGYVYTLSVSDTRTYTLYSIIKEYVQPDSIIYTDTYRSYDILDVSDFQHCRINHSKEFARDNNHINGIENFWNQAKRHMRKYNGIPKVHFDLYLKECEFRFNYRPIACMYETLYNWVKEAGFLPI